MKQAYLYQLLDEKEKKIECNLCSHRCKIAHEKRGICQVRENRDGVLYSLVYCQLVSRGVDPIEKKPLFHFQPGSRSYSIATVGCNFRCLHCQNWQISQYPRLNQGKITGETWSPEAIVEEAVKTGSSSISYTYVEPTIFFETAYDTGKIARKHGIKNIFVSNGYMTPECNSLLTEFLDGINIDLKAFSDRFYKEVCKARLKPVLDSIEQLHQAGIWVEVTTLIIPGWNDSEGELREIARFIKGVDPGIPWHVTAFHPTYKMMDRPPTPAATLRRAREIGLEEGLRFVYQGNIPGEGGENTFCPGCGTILIRRFGFSIQENRISHDGKCPECGELIEGVWK